MSLPRRRHRGAIFALLLGLTLPSASADAVVLGFAIEAAAERIEACGLGVVTMRYEADLQLEVLSAVGVPSLTDEQLACADEAAGYFHLEVPPAVQPRYAAIREKRVSAQVLREAEAWVAQRGMAGRVPKYEPGVSSEKAFGRQLEELCGPRARGALQSEYGAHVIDPRWYPRQHEPAEEAVRALTCLTNVARVADFELGFIGNEASAGD